MYNPFHNRPDEWALFQPIIGTRMLELGCKINAPTSARGATEAEKKQYTYKVYFEDMGIDHTSLDWNGMYGSLNRDLREPLWDELGEFDILTNLGTTEHVNQQEMAWENIHRMTKVGGVYVGLTPYHDGKSWQWHGEWWPTEAFFESFAKLNGWKIEQMHKGGDIPHQNLCVRMRKVKDKDFTMPDLSLFVRNKTGHADHVRPR